MMPRYLKCIFCFSIFLLGGCADMRPVPIREPQTMARSTAILAPVTELSKGTDYIAAYRDTYYKASEDLRGDDYLSSDVTLAGGVIGVLGGVAKSAGTALGGGLIASGSSLIDKRYAYAIQAENYEKAGDAMHCMYKAYALANPKDENYDKALVLKSLSDNVDSVRIKLRKSQSKINLLSPNTDELKKNLIASQAASDNQKTSQMNLTNSLSQQGISSLSQATSSMLPTLNPVVEQLKDDNTKKLTTELDACSASL